MPSRAAASASIRPSWPPPSMPIVLPCGSGSMSIVVARKFRHSGGLASAVGVERGGDLGVAERQHRGGEEGGVGGTSLADGERADRYSGRHLDDRQQAVLSRQR